MSELKNLKIHVVDDDPDVLVVVKALLEDFGAKVKTSTSSKKALSEIIEDKPDLAILDLMMPEMDGLDLTRLLRKETDLEKLKIVIFSGKSYEQDQQRAFSFGADGYLTKPLITDEFVAKLQDIVEEKVEVTYWGVRGTLPVPGKGSLRYGGNTVSRQSNSDKIA